MTCITVEALPLTINRRSLLTGFLTGTLLLTGCIAVSDRPVDSAPRPPPQVIVEQMPPAPGPAFVWQPGHWRWNGHDYFWVPGHYVERPRHVREWVAPHWEQRNGAYVLFEGHWR